MESFHRYIVKKKINKKINYKKANLNDLLLAQLLPHINNMKEFDVDKRIIIKIFDEFLEKYNYLNKESYNTLFSIISNNISEIEKYRKEYKENPELEKELYNENQEYNSIDLNNKKINKEERGIEINKIEKNESNE